MWKVSNSFNISDADFHKFALKDVSIVKYNNKHHIFYTASGLLDHKQEYTIGCITTENFIDFSTPVQLTNLCPLDNTYYCAPQVFYYDKHKLWYMIYQVRSNIGWYEAVYSTSTDIEDCLAWTAPQPLLNRSDDKKNSRKWIDFWCIGDKEAMYLFYASGDKMAMRSTFDFPNNFSNENLFEVHGGFEAPHIYHSLKDNNFYLIFEGKEGSNGRYFVLAKNENLHSLNWEVIDKHYASHDNIEKNNWTDMVSHGEIIRSTANQNLNIDDIYSCEILIQGTTLKNYEIDYPMIPWKLGIIKNSSIVGKGD